MILVNFKTYSGGTGERAIGLAGICQAVGKKMGVEIIPVVQTVDLWRIKQEFPQLPVYIQHLDWQPQGQFTGWTNLEAVVEAGAGGTLVNHSEHQVPPGTIKKVQSSKFKVHFQIVVCAKTLGQAERLVRLKPDFLAYEPPELIGAQQASVATVQAKTIKKVVEIGKGRNVPVVVGAGIHSAEDVKISLKMGAVGILVSSYVVLAKEQKKALEELAEAFV